MSVWTNNVITMYFKNLFSPKMQANLSGVASSKIPLECFNRIPYYSNLKTNEINNKFLDHDGYFVKLIIKNKVVGYIFRCTFKDAEFTLVNGEKVVIPFFVSCYYQPMLKHVPNNIVKLLGKDHALKTALRSFSFLAKGATKVDFMEYFKYHDLSHCFPPYEQICKLVGSFDKPELFEFDEIEYNKLLDYIKAFDEKIEKYYSGINSKNIFKIWLS